jgi:hypothetical protein
MFPSTFHKSLLVTLTLCNSLHLLVGATPFRAVPRQLQDGPNCALNAMGKGVSIRLISPALDLIPTFSIPGTILRALSGNFEEPEFLLQQNGQPEGKLSYIIK